MRAGGTARLLAGALAALLAAGGAAAAGQGDEIIIIADEGETPAPAPAGGGAAPPACPSCSESAFHVTGEEVSDFDVRQENGDEDVVESLLRIESGFTWKKKGWGKADLAAKATARLDLLLAGGEDPGGEWEVSRSEADFTLLEWFVEIVTAPVDLRIGSQHLRFSRCDLLAPADILSPPDLRETYRGEWALPRMPALALRADWKLPEGLVVSAVLVPFYEPPRYDLFGTDRAILGAGAPEGIRQWLSLFDELVDPTIAGRLRDALVATKLPARWGPNQSVALRIEKSGGAVDAALTYVFTFGPVPELSVNPNLMAAMLLVQDGQPGAAAELLAGAANRGEKLLDTTYRRMHVLALDFSAEAGPLVLSGEVAWVPRQVFTAIELRPMTDPLTGLPMERPLVFNVRAGVVSAALQAQYDFGEAFALVGEVAWRGMLDPETTGAEDGAPRVGSPPPTLLFGDRTQQLLVGLATRATFLGGALAWSVTGQVSALDKSMIIASRLSWQVAGRVTPFLGFVLYEAFGSRPSPDLSAAASRDTGDIVFVGMEIQ